MLQNYIMNIFETEHFMKSISHKMLNQNIVAYVSFNETQIFWDILMDIK